MIALVAYVESFSIGTTLGTRQRTRVNSHQELIALGAANVGRAFTGAYPVAGSFSRSSVNYQSGARTQVSSLVCMVVIVLTLLFFTPLFTLLPHAALAAIVIVSVFGLMDFQRESHWKVHRRRLHHPAGHADHRAGVSAWRPVSSPEWPVDRLLRARVEQTPHRHRRPGRRSASTFARADATTWRPFAHVAAIRVDESLFFANANQVESKLLKIIQRRPAPATCCWSAAR